jgi:hypothetical protein
MKYTIPTNKLRDLIAVLQTLDPDIEHNIPEVDVIMDGRRVMSTGEYTEAEFVEDIRDRCGIECPPSINSLAIAIEDLFVEKEDLTTERDELKSQIDGIKRVLGVD